MEHAPDAAVGDDVVVAAGGAGDRGTPNAQGTPAGVDQGRGGGRGGRPDRTAAERDRAGVESRRRRHVAQEHVGVLEAIVAHERLGGRREGDVAAVAADRGQQARVAAGPPVPGDRDQDRVGEHDVALVDLGLGRCHGSEMGVGPQGRWAQQVGRRRLERDHPPVGRDRRQSALAPRGLAARRHRDEGRLARGEVPAKDVGRAVAVVRDEVRRRGLERHDLAIGRDRRGSGRAVRSAIGRHADLARSTAAHRPDVHLRPRPRVRVGDDVAPVRHVGDDAAIGRDRGAPLVAPVGWPLKPTETRSVARARRS